MVEARKGKYNRLYFLIIFVFDGDEPDNQHRRTKNEGPQEDIDRNKTTCKQRLHRRYYHYYNNTRVLDALDGSVNWARMKIKLQKSRRLIIKKG